METREETQSNVATALGAWLETLVIVERLAYVHKDKAHKCWCVFCVRMSFGIDPRRHGKWPQ